MHFSGTDALKKNSAVRAVYIGDDIFNSTFVVQIIEVTFDDRGSNVTLQT